MNSTLDIINKIEYDYIKELVDKTIAEYREDNITGWSMQEVLDVMDVAGFNKDIAREYMLKEYFDIPDEQKYIDSNINAVRQQYMRIQLFDKDVTQSEISVE